MSREGLGRRLKGNVCPTHEQMFCMSVVGALGKKQNIYLPSNSGWICE